MAYAADFEVTFEDDDWSRLEKYFAPDATYEVTGSAMACRLLGPAAIFAGIKKSLDGFDRPLGGRTMELTSEPKVDGGCFDVDWEVTYRKQDAPDYILKGHSRARYADDVIVELVDSYGPEVDDLAAAWIGRYAPEVDPTYT